MLLLRLAGGRKRAAGRKISIGACCPHPLQRPSVFGQPVNKLNFPFFVGRFVAFPPLPQYKVEALVPQKDFSKLGCWQNTPQLCIGGEGGGHKTHHEKGKLSLLTGGSIFEHVSLHVGLCQNIETRARLCTGSSYRTAWRILFFWKTHF